MNGMHQDEGSEFVIKDLATSLYYTGSKRRDQRWGPEESAKVLTKSQAHNAMGGLRNGTTNPLVRVKLKKT